MNSISENFTFIMKLSFIRSDLHNYLLIQVMKIQLHGKCAHIFKVLTEHRQITPLNFEQLRGTWIIMKGPISNSHNLLERKKKEIYFHLLAKL